LDAIKCFRFLAAPSALAVVATLALAGCSGTGVTTPAAGSGAMQQQSVAGTNDISVGRRSLSRGTSVLRPGIQYVRPGNRGTYLMNEEAKKSSATRIVVSDAENDVIDILNEACKVVGQIPGFSEPQGIAVDKDDAIYVADTGNSDVVIYAKPYNGKPKNLNDSGQYPAGVAVDNDLNVAAANIISTAGGPGSITFFDKNGKRGKTIANSSFARVYFDAFDKSGNLFLDGETPSGDAVIGEIIGGAIGKSITILTTGNSFEFPGGIEVNENNQPVIDDQVGSALCTYDQPKKGSLGNPVFTTPLKATDPVTFALTSTDADLWAADAGAVGVAEYLYPKGGSPAKSCMPQGSQPTGIAILPPNIP
jgi:hypothetical protein